MEHRHHHHHHNHSKNQKALFVSFIIISLFTIVEFFGGLLTNSLALFSDAGHMLSDTVSLGVGLLAVIFGAKTASVNKTFGYKRMEILAALFNGILLMGIAIFIMWESFQRFAEPEVIESTGMFIVAVIGAIVNVIVALILHSGDTSDNINMRAAFLHVIGDLLGSVSAIVASLLIMFLGWNYADPIASLIVSLLILRSGIVVTDDAIHVLMEGRPVHLDAEQIRNRLLDLPGVVGIHDFHVWSITTDFPSVSCHLVISGSNHDSVLQEALRELHDTFHIEHCTIQVESVSANLDQYEHHRCNSFMRVTKSEF